ncbi:hypothetical protein C0J52_11573 [Blattella germanica]|nr:hypothetical protein C0J52_11573 [Blattella germanica]
MKWTSTEAQVERRLYTYLMELHFYGTFVFINLMKYCFKMPLIDQSTSFINTTSFDPLRATVS